MTTKMQRRMSISLLGGAAAGWPLAVPAQQPAMPVVGFLDTRAPDAMTHRLRVFRQSLKEAGFVEGQDATIEYRSAEDQTRLPLLVADFLRRQIALIVGNTPAALAAKAATTTVPIVFGTNLRGSSFGSCVSCGREPRALPCSSMPNGP